jgi:hypothetical protein
VRHKLSGKTIHGFRISTEFDILRAVCGYGHFFRVIRDPDRLCGLVVRVLCYRSRYPGYGFRSYQNFREVVGMERFVLCLVSAIEELLGKRNSGSSLETENTVVRIRHADNATPLYPQKLALTSPTSDGLSYSSLADRGHGVCALFNMRSRKALLVVHRRFGGT